MAAELLSHREVPPGHETTHPVYFVGAGPGDPELITVKGKRLLQAADVVVYAGSLVNPVLVNKLDADLHNSAGMDLDEIISVMAGAHRQGKRVVRLHTGDPSIYGAISEQIRRLEQIDIPFEIIPGVSSAMAAASRLPAELTVPEITQTVILTRRAGRTPVPERESLASLAAAQATMCIFLSVSSISEVSRELEQGGYLPETPVAVIEKATWPDERVIRGTLANIASLVEEAGIRKTAMIIVGSALLDNISTESRLYHRKFHHGFRAAGDD